MIITDKLVFGAVLVSLIIFVAVIILGIIALIGLAVIYKEDSK